MADLEQDVARTSGDWKSYVRCAFKELDRPARAGWARPGLCGRLRRASGLLSFEKDSGSECVGAARAAPRPRCGSYRPGDWVGGSCLDAGGTLPERAGARKPIALWLGRPARAFVVLAGGAFGREPTRVTKVTPPAPILAHPEKRTTMTAPQALLRPFAQQGNQLGCATYALEVGDSGTAQRQAKARSRKTGRCARRSSAH